MYVLRATVEDHAVSNFVSHRFEVDWQRLFATAADKADQRMSRDISETDGVGVAENE